MVVMNNTPTTTTIKGRITGKVIMKTCIGHHTCKIKGLYKRRGDLTCRRH